MRVLLDEQLPRLLADELVGHEVRTVQQQGWAGLTNGELLRQAAVGGLEVFVTADQNLEFQQNVAKSPVGVVVLRAASMISFLLLRKRSRRLRLCHQVKSFMLLHNSPPSRCSDQQRGFK